MPARQMVRIPTNYYRHFDADFRLDVPAEGYGGWQKKDLEISFDHTALVIMHAWECGTREQYPGWHRVVEFIPRAQAICRTVFPPLLGAVRKSGMRLYHVVSSGPYAQDYPGYRRAVALAGPLPAPPEQIPSDPARDALIAFKSEYAYHGLHNRKDIERGFANLTFPPEALPAGEEGIAENGPQLFALCKADGINHLIYAGFAINWCLLLSPGGMAEMSRHGLICSALRQAVTAVENKETARKELCKEIALWRVALSFGFVFDVDDFIRALQGVVCHAGR
ncbi:MAG: hypothetical protein ABIH24_07580 [Verrucomicrobiota bacterium]